MAVFSLNPNDAIAPNNVALADKLRALADEVEGGACGKLRHIVVLFNGDVEEPLRCYGLPATNAEVVGIVEYAKFDFMRPDGQED